jgi:integrase
MMNKKPMTEISTSTKGVKYREHETRKHGKQKDRYFFIRYTFDGKDKKEALGWASEGWSEKKAAEYLFELKKNQRTGEGARTLAEKREQAQKQKEEEAAKTKKEESKVITFAQLHEKYLPFHKMKTEKKTWQNDEIFYNNYFKATLADKPIEKISLDDLQAIINEALEAGKSPATAKHMKAVLRQMFNFAIEHELYTKKNIAAKIHILAFDNRRTRFLTIEEVQMILKALKAKSPQVHDMALLSMLSGAREGEIFSLQWENINFNTKFMTLVDTKNNNKTRHLPMTQEIEKLLKTMRQENSTGLVFTTKDGNPIKYLSKTYARTIEELGFNKKITDKRQRVVFHTLRHSYASWLMMEGADLYVVKELLGHSTTAMTERYSHLSPEHLRKTAALLNRHKIVLEN